MLSLKTQNLTFLLIVSFMLNWQWNFSEEKVFNYCLKFLVLPSELSTLFYKIYLDVIWLFFRTKVVSRCGLTTACNRVNKHDVLQLLLIISYMNWSDSKNKEAKQQKLVLLSSFTLLLRHFLYYTEVTIWKSRHQHWHCRYFCLTKCFMKKYTTVFFYVLSYSALESFNYSYSFPNDFLPCSYETSQ